MAEDTAARLVTAISQPAARLSFAAATVARLVVGKSASRPAPSASKLAAPDYST